MTVLLVIDSMFLSTRQYYIVERNQSMLKTLSQLGQEGTYQKIECVTRQEDLRYLQYHLSYFQFTKIVETCSSLPGLRSESENNCVGEGGRERERDTDGKRELV